MNQKTVKIGNEQITLKKAENLEEVLQVQDFDALIWTEGYKHYRTLFELDHNSIYVALNESGEIVSYVGVERISQTDLGTGMPPWDHDPRGGWHKPNGDTWYIAGHAVDKNYRRSGLSNEMIEYLKQMAKVNNIPTISVILRINHPTLGRSSNFWEHHGFARLEHTFDPSWKASLIAEDSGGVIYATGNLLSSNQ